MCDLYCFGVFIGRKRNLHINIMSEPQFNYRFDDIKGNSFAYSYTRLDGEGIGKMQVKLIGDISSKMESIEQCKQFVKIVGMEVSENKSDNEYTLTIKTPIGESQHDRILMVARRFIEQEQIIIQNQNGESLSKNFERVLIAEKMIDPPIEFSKSCSTTVEMVGVRLMESGTTHDPTKDHVSNRQKIKPPPKQNFVLIKAIKNIVFPQKSKRIELL